VRGRVFQVLLSTLDREGRLLWERAFLDAAFVPAKRGEKVGLTRWGKGSKVMLVVAGQALPPGVLVESAQRSEVGLAEEALRPVRASPTRTQGVVADQGYDGEALRPRLRARGIAPCIPWGKERPGPAGAEAGPVGLPAEVGGGADLRLAGGLSETGGEMGKKGPDLPGLPLVGLLPYLPEDYSGMSCSLADDAIKAKRLGPKPACTDAGPAHPGSARRSPFPGGSPPTRHKPFLRFMSGSGLLTRTAAAFASSGFSNSHNAS
jgi:hypothetical protein